MQLFTDVEGHTMMIGPQCPSYATLVKSLASASEAKIQKVVRTLCLALLRFAIVANTKEVKNPLELAVRKIN